jgi:hypothetical protein
MRADIDADQWFRTSEPHRPESPGLAVLRSEEQSVQHTIAHELSEQTSPLFDVFSLEDHIALFLVRNISYASIMSTYFRFLMIIIDHI